MPDEGLLKDVTDSIKASLYERVTSPLLGTFTIAWLLENWKILLIIVSGDGSVYERITYIQSNLLDYASILWRPLIISAIVLICYPFVALAPLVIWEFTKSIRVRIRNYYELGTPLTIEQSRKLRQELHDLTKRQFEYEELLSKANELLTQQKSLINQAEQSQKSTNQDPSLKEALKNIDILQKEIAQLKQDDPISVIAQPPLSDPAAIWSTELDTLLSNSNEFEKAMNTFINYVPDNLDDMPTGTTQYLLSLGLVSRNKFARPQQVTLTQKGTFMSEKYAMMKTTGQLSIYMRGD